VTGLFPFLAAIAIYLATPILNAHAKATIARWLAEASRDATVPESRAPDYLAPKQIYDYIDFAADHAQVLPAVVLTSIGVVLALPEDLTPTTAASFTLATVLILLVTEVRVLSVSPQQYAAMKRFGYSFVALVGIGINAAGVVVVLVLNLMLN
jgi:hypothetical protein